MTNKKMDELKKKCYCEYTKDGNMVGLCLRCGGLEIKGFVEGRKQERQKILEEIKKYKEEDHWFWDVTGCEDGCKYACDDILQRLEKK